LDSSAQASLNDLHLLGESLESVHDPEVFPKLNLYDLVVAQLEKEPMALKQSNLLKSTAKNNPEDPEHNALVELDELVSLELLEVAESFLPGIKQSLYSNMSVAEHKLKTMRAISTFDIRYYYNYYIKRIIKTICNVWL